MDYEDDLEDETTCLDIIDAEFVKKYPITTRRHDLIQHKQQRGQPLTTYINNMPSSVWTGNGEGYPSSVVVCRLKTAKTVLTTTTEATSQT